MVVLYLKVKSFQYRTVNKGKKDLVLGSYQLSAISYQLSAISYQLSGRGNKLAKICTD